MEQFANSLQFYLKEDSLLALPVAFLAGVLVSFTPCTYPVIPIQLGFIGIKSIKSQEIGGASKKFNLRGFWLSVLFVIGMSIVYAILGTFAALTGTLFGVWASSPWTYLIVANIILIFALSMLEVFSVPTPQFLLRWSPKGKNTSYVSALLIGASSGLIVGPCTAPALGAILAYVGMQGNVIFGGILLFVFAIGMGTLMIILGTVGGAIYLLPRSGEWMQKIKIILGILMITIAEYLLIQAGKRFM